MKHEGYTQAPWVIDREWNRILGSDGRGTIICEMGNLKNDEIAANASLIADAPRLAEENQKLRDFVGSVTAYFQDTDSPMGMAARALRAETKP